MLTCLQMERVARKLRKILRQAVDMISGEAHYGAADQTLSGLGSVPLWSIAKLSVDFDDP